jgi:aryl-alcohol dehydrogenase-like predicted oxidoreductase
MSGIPLRDFGKTGVKLAALGLGGHHLGDAESYSTAERIVHEAVDGGIMFFDNCWEYHNGRSEDWMGRALKGRRDKAFLMTKVCTHGRDKALALRMLDQSLRRLQTDHLDLWQLHGITFDNDPDLAFKAGGGYEALLEARKQGKIRFIGFTGHKDPKLHLAMLQRGQFDAVQMPLNAFDAQFRSFEQQVLPEAVKRGVAVLGMKPMCGTADPIQKSVVTAEEALRYAMSLSGVSLTISGMDKLEVLQKNLKLAQNFTPMTADELAQVRKKAAAAAPDGRFELYKMSLKYDNPEARKAHGFPEDDQSKETKEKLEAAKGKEEGK